MRWFLSTGAIRWMSVRNRPSTFHSGPAARKRIGTFFLGSVVHSMRSVVGLRLPTIAGTQGDHAPSSNRWMDWTGMKAWRASVRSGSWVEKKLGNSTTR